MIRELCAHTWHWKKRENQKLLYEVKKIRNTIIHDVFPISYSDVEVFISHIETLRKIAVYRGY